MKRWSFFPVIVLLITILWPGVARAADCLSAVDAPGCMYGLPADQYQSLLGQMQANPAPNVSQIGVDAADLRRYNLWQLNRSGVTYYDGPEGSPIGSTDSPGYSFVAPTNHNGDWYEVAPGAWVHRSSLSGTRASDFTGVLLNGALPFPMAWVVEASRASELPGKSASRSTPLIPQYTRVYLYTTVKVGNWEWYLIGPGQWIEQRHVGRFVQIAPPGVGGRWVSVDLYEQVFTAYENDRPVFVTLISSGLNKWPTEEGLFKIWSRLTADAMNGAMGKPDEYNIPVVPYVMYFNGSMALHGAFWHNGFGRKHSHGCVNMSVGDSHWLYDWATVDTPVYVWHSR
jgi:hypothetical protein